MKNKTAETLGAVHTHTHTHTHTHNTFIQRGEGALLFNALLSFGAKGGNNIELPHDIE